MSCRVTMSFLPANSPRPTKAGMLKKLCFLFFVAMSALLLGSCSDTSETKQNSSNSQVSSIPWNRPEKWEGTGMLPGGMGTQ